MRDSCLDDLSYSFYDMLCLSERHGINTSIDCTDETIVVMGLPVMSGRIPEICKEMLSKVNGNGAYLIALVSYGNNSYGDALYELYTYANERGFNVIVQQHLSHSTRCSLRLQRVDQMRTISRR